MTPSSTIALHIASPEDVGASDLEPSSFVSQEFEVRPGIGRLEPIGDLPGHLFCFADKLTRGEAIWVEAHCAFDGMQSIALSAGASLIVPSAQGKERKHLDRCVEGLRQALLLTFPGSEICSSEMTHPVRQASRRAIPLRGAPVHLTDLSGSADPDLCVVSPRKESAPRHVKLGAFASRNVLSDALRVLRRAPGPLTLRLTLRPRALLIQEIRELSALYESLVDLRGSLFVTSTEVDRVTNTTALVAEWLSAKSGVQLLVSVSSDIPLSDSVASALSTALSLPPSARRDSAVPVVDLSGCFARGQRRPDLTLDRDICQHLVIRGSSAVFGSAAPSQDFIGITSHDCPVGIDSLARSRHLFVCGSTGTGKSTLMKNMIESDVQNGFGVILLDPHGDLFQDVLAILNRDPDIPVWVADTADLSAPYSLNLFQSAGDPFRQNFVCNQLIRILKNSMYKDVPQGFGPMWEAYFRNGFLLLADGGGGSYTISDMDRVFGDARFRRELFETCSNEHVSRFWRNIASRAGGDAALENIAPYIVSKLTQFVGNPVISPIVSARTSTIDFQEVLATSGGVCIINLAKGQVGATEAEILGGVFTTAIFSAALSRAGLSPTQRRPVRVYLDEFQSYAGDVISEMLAECRKYGLEMTLATQSLSRLQIMSGDLSQSVLGNVGNIIALRSGPRDAALLADWLGGGVTREEITSLDDFKAIGRFLEKGKVTPPIPFRLEETLRKRMA